MEHSLQILAVSLGPQPPQFLQINELASRVKPVPWSLQMETGNGCRELALVWTVFRGRVWWWWSRNNDSCVPSFVLFLSVHENPFRPYQCEWLLARKTSPRTCDNKTVPWSQWTVLWIAFLKRHSHRTPACICDWPDSSPPPPFSSKCHTFLFTALVSTVQQCTPHNSQWTSAPCSVL